MKEWLARGENSYDVVDPDLIRAIAQRWVSQECYFDRSDATVKPVVENLYSQLLQLRETFVMQDDTGLAGPEPATRQTAWQRTNAFTEPV